MRRTWVAFQWAAFCCAWGCVAAAQADVEGVYLETRTCQVYTGPCFANGEVGLAGKDAIMAWGIRKGQHDGVDLAGLNVVLVLRASDTLGFRGLNDAQQLASVIYVDQRADSRQREALVSFARQHAGRAGRVVNRIDQRPIAMALNLATLEGAVTAGTEVTVRTRAARRGDCICSNESAYYPPLAEVESFAPGVTIEGRFNGRGLGTRWSTPGDRSAYMATFAY